MILGGILIIGIETKCGMIGLGVIQAGILGVLLIDGHHLDMIDGDMESTMVGITTDGDIMGTMVMDGIIITGGTITVKMVGTEDEVEIMCRISTVEEVVL
jgi:hypothetical protein